MMTEYQKPENQFEKDFPPGTRFKYLDIEMLSVSVWDGYVMSGYPTLTSEYVDANGVINKKTFRFSMYDVLMAENGKNEPSFPSHGERDK
jgi:hypothetical protein